MIIKIKMTSQKANTAAFDIDAGGKVFKCTEVYSDGVLVNQSFTYNDQPVTEDQRQKLTYVLNQFSMAMATDN